MVRPCHQNHSSGVVIAPPETQSKPLHHLRASQPSGPIAELAWEIDRLKSIRIGWTAPVPYASELVGGEGWFENLKS